MVEGAEVVAGVVEMVGELPPLRGEIIMFFDRAEPLEFFSVMGGAEVVGAVVLVDVDLDCGSRAMKYRTSEDGQEAGDEGVV